MESSFLLHQKFMPRQLSKDNRPFALPLFFVPFHATPKIFWVTYRSGMEVELPAICVHHINLAEARR